MKKKSPIRALREAKGLTLEEMAAKAGVSVGTASQMENHKMRNPSIRTISNIARALEVPFIVLAERYL